MLINLTPPVLALINLIHNLTIQCKLNESDQWRTAIIQSRGAKQQEITTTGGALVVQMVNKIT